MPCVNAAATLRLCRAVLQLLARKTLGRELWLLALRTSADLSGPCDHVIMTKIVLECMEFVMYPSISNRKQTPY